MTVSKSSSAVLTYNSSGTGYMVPPQWHQLVLAYLETFVVPRTAWIAHWDVDEFLLPPTVTSYNTGYSKIPTIASHDHSSTPRWTFPTQEQFRAFPSCVPINRRQYLPEDEGEYEYGNLSTSEWQTVTGTHVWRDPQAEQRAVAAPKLQQGCLTLTVRKGIYSQMNSQSMLHPLYSRWTSSWMCEFVPPDGDRQAPPTQC